MGSGTELATAILNFLDTCIKRITGYWDRKQKHYGSMNIILKLLRIFSFISMDIVFVTEVIRRYWIPFTPIKCDFGGYIRSFHTLHFGVTTVLFALLLVFFVATQQKMNLVYWGCKKNIDNPSEVGQVNAIVGTFDYCVEIAISFLSMLKFGADMLLVLTGQNMWGTLNILTYILMLCFHIPQIVYSIYLEIRVEQKING